MAKVTVYMSSYNHARFLKEAIESVLNQTFTDFELFIEDDASEDESWQLIERYQDPRIKAFRNPFNRNDKEGMRKVFFELGSGEYFAVHHSDNIWETTKLAQQVRYLEEHLEVAAVFTRTLLIDESGSPVDESAPGYFNVFDQPNRSRQQWLNHLFHHGNALCHPSILMRRSVFEACGFHRAGFIQLPDYDMWVRLCLKHEIHILQDKLVQFRILSNEQNLSGNRLDARLRIEYEALKTLQNYRQLDTFSDLESVFPEARAYFNPDGCVPEYVLAMIALDSQGFARPQKELLALDLLFDALNDPEKKRELDRLYGFRQLHFKRLTAAHDPFALRSQMALQEKNCELEQTRKELDEMKRSKAWQVIRAQRDITQRLRKARFFAPIAAAAETAFWKTRLRGQLKLLRSSGLFDQQWYVTHNPELADSGMHPAVHFLLHGGTEGRDPGPQFSSSYYLQRYTDVQKAGVNPLIHYICHGAAERREKMLEPEYLEALSRYRFQGSEFSPVERAQREWLEPQMFDYFGRSKKIVQREGHLWAIKSGMTFLHIKRELLANSLSQGLVNACELRTLTRQDCLALIDLGIAGPETLPENTLLIRLAQDYTSAELPLKTGDEALAGEFVFCLFIRRRDLNAFNHANAKDGVRVFYDLNASMNFEDGVLDVERFFSNTTYGHPGYWRVRERNGQVLDILDIRENYHDYRYQLIDDRERFLEGVDRITTKIVRSDFDMRAYIKRAGYTGSAIEPLARFLEETQRRLPADVEKMLRVLFSPPPANWKEEIINPKIG